MEHMYPCLSMYALYMHTMNAWSKDAFLCYYAKVDQEPYWCIRRKKLYTDIKNEII